MTTLRTRLIAAMADASRTAVTKHNKEQRRLGNYEPGESADGATAELIKMAAALDALAAVLEAEGLRVVPVVATDEMKAASGRIPHARDAEIFAAMLSAAPDPLAPVVEDTP